jgi:isoleucyl-tRNA synthetase
MSSSGPRHPGRSPATGRSPIRRAYPTASTRSPKRQRFRPAPGRKADLRRQAGGRILRQGQARIQASRDVTADELGAITCAHPLASARLRLQGSAPRRRPCHRRCRHRFRAHRPSHGREDFDAWMPMPASSKPAASPRKIPFTVDDAGFYTADAPVSAPIAPKAAASWTTTARRATPTSASSRR